MLTFLPEQIRSHVKLQVILLRLSKLTYVGTNISFSTKLPGRTGS